MSIIYLIVISIALLIPLDFYFITEIVAVEDRPNNKTSYLIHLVLFFLLFSLLNYAFNKQSNLLILCLCYAIIIEILQFFTGRGFQISDIIYNILGILISRFFLRVKKS